MTAKSTSSGIRLRLRYTRRRLRRWHDRLTPRQRRRIVLVALLLFAAVDMWLFARGMAAETAHIAIPNLNR